MSAHDAPDGPTPFLLTAQEKQSGLWMRLENHLRERLASMRGQNDGALDQIQTATLRGQISFAKALLGLGQELPPLEDE